MQCQKLEDCGLAKPDSCFTCPRNPRLENMSPGACAGLVQMVGLAICDDYLACMNEVCDVQQICIDLIIRQSCWELCDLTDGDPGCPGTCRQFTDERTGTDIVGVGVCSPL